MDYCGLNVVTVKYMHPLPLTYPAIDQLGVASIYTKLDLRSDFVLVRIRVGYEWKTAFRITSGHYHYLVMPHGLANAPSCFKALMNDIFQVWLNQFIISLYINILKIFSEHILHVCGPPDQRHYSPPHWC